MITKRVELIHKEHNEECFEILKSTIVKDNELKKFRIDKDTLLHELPEKVVNEFLDFLSGFNREHRQITLGMIKNGTLILHCWEDEEGDNIGHFPQERDRIEKLVSEINEIHVNPESDEFPF